ncbi:hypothetical protein HF086_000116 [Spodoptera exigua]|uniref:Uncharacterized protein n=1 Tax=Spodoptera exigua TaxID=7107 RepID=A0A922SKQ2_SPOEX|nr:hypothetical protein HF086_000116 [Spodoptera exigua]
MGSKPKITRSQHCHEQPTKGPITKELTQLIIPLCSATSMAGSHSGPSVFCRLETARRGHRTVSVYEWSSGGCIVMVMRRRCTYKGARGLLRPVTADMWRPLHLLLLLPALLILWSGCSEAAPFLNLLGLLASGSTNSSGLLETLLLSHLQKKINALNVLEDFIAIAANITGT